MSRYAAAQTRLRAWTARLTPRVVTNYPFEVLAAVVGLLIGIPLIIGVAAPASLVLLLPDFAYWLYAVAISLAGATVAVGLKIRSPFLLSSGLQLSGGAYLVYAAAVVIVGGWTLAWAAFGCFTAMGLVAMVRSLHFRRLIDIQKGATDLMKGATE